MEACSVGGVSNPAPSIRYPRLERRRQNPPTPLVRGARPDNTRLYKRETCRRGFQPRSFEKRIWLVVTQFIACSSNRACLKRVLARSNAIYCVSLGVEMGSVRNKERAMNCPTTNGTLLKRGWLVGERAMKGFLITNGALLKRRVGL